MSYNDDPEWTKNIVIPNFSEVACCPICGVASDSLGDADGLLEGGFYAPRHIPPYLTFVCTNVECVCCDREFYMKLSVYITHSAPQAIRPEEDEMDE